LDYPTDKQAMGHTTEIQALDYHPDQQAMGHPAEIQAVGYSPISKQCKKFQ
jgi:hypothetical protein